MSEPPEQAAKALESLSLAEVDDPQRIGPAQTDELNDEALATTQLIQPAGTQDAAQSESTAVTATTVKDVPQTEGPPPPQRSRPTVLLHAPSMAYEVKGATTGTKRTRCRMGLSTGLKSLGARYESLPPGARTSHPHAHRLEDEVVFCVSGEGIIWQNGWTYPFMPGDFASWKAGTGVVHTVINDSNRGGAPGEDLVILTAGEHRDDEQWFYPLSPERRAAIKPEQIWQHADVPLHNEFGPHPGTSCFEAGKDDLPMPVEGTRPTNIAHGPSTVEASGSADLFGYCTSLSSETNFNGSFGCNLEILPPGTRSSYPHAHSMEEELVFVLNGTGLVWIDGHTTPIYPGDVVGFPPGTGIAHTFINDTGGGEDDEDASLWLWIVGENRRNTGDMVHYPLNPARNVTSPRWWSACPERELGPHNGRPSRPRKD